MNYSAGFNLLLALDYLSCAVIIKLKKFSFYSSIFVTRIRGVIKI